MTAPWSQSGHGLPTLDAGDVRLRWLTEADVPALFAIFGDPQVTRYWGFDILPDPAAATVLLADIHRQFHAGTLLQWGVETRDTGLSGTCTLAQFDERNRRAELGFALGRGYWGRGIMKAALPAVIDFAFDQLGLHRIFADTDPRNIPARRALERLGFVREGQLRQHYWVRGEPQDAVMFGLLRSEWAPRATSSR
jgi:RimJ/RimL family protein N-acetyltransferase